MTVYSEGVWRKQVTATRPNPGVEAKQVVMIPEGVTDLTIYAKGSAASSCLVEESPSSGEAIQFGTPTPEWVQVDASLASVGTTLTRFVLGDRTPVALRVSSLIDNQTATLILVGRRVGR
jgi:hypothetical protein